MALIKCAECGKEISDTLKTCPNCGIEIKGNKKQESKKGLSKVDIIILVILSLFSLYSIFIVLNMITSSAWCFSIMVSQILNAISYVSTILMLWFIFMYKLNGKKIFKMLSSIFITTGILFHLINSMLLVGSDILAFRFNLRGIFDYYTIFPILLYLYMLKDDKNGNN